MGLNELLPKVTDPYERKARLWPALLALFPLIAMMELLYGAKLSALMNIAMLAISCGGLFLLTNICREIGKRLEPKLYREWGGKPTTQLLRHRDASIEGVTKLRYHSFLAGNINVPFPKPEDETINNIAADDVYQSAVRWLLNQTRDTKKYELLFQENITYGFRRNALGLKPFGLASALCSIIWILLACDVITISSVYFINKEALLALPETAIISLAGSLVMLLMWMLFFTKESVRTAAFTYAETLLRSCDTLNGKKLKED